MKPIAFPLARGMERAEVAELHRALARLGATLAEDEVEKSALGPSTSDAVAALQREAGLEATGEVDEPTAALITTRLADGGVRGRVVPRGRPGPVDELRVEVWKGEERVAAAVTDAEGRFDARFDGDTAGGVHLRVFRGADLVQTVDAAPADGDAEIPIVLEGDAGRPRVRLLRDLLDAAPKHLPKRLRERADEPEGGDVWAALRDDPEVDESDLRELRVTGKLLDLAEGSAPVVREMHSLRGKGEPVGPALAALDADGWRALVERALDQDAEALPPVEGEDREAAWARRLERATERAFPTAFLANRLARGPELDAASRTLARRRDDGGKPEGGKPGGNGGKPDGGLPDEVLAETIRREARIFPGFDAERALAEAAETGAFRNPVRERVAEILARDPELDLATRPVDEILRPDEAAAEAPAEDEAVASSLRRLQRVFQVAPRWERMHPLLDEGMDSALAISRVGRRSFVERFGEALGGAEEAAAVQGRAEEVTAATTLLATTVYQSMHDAQPMVTGGSAASRALALQLPDWTSLFGRVDFCECPHCRSVYSPAAYLVELLEYLRSVPGRASGSTALQRLLDRRPDLEHIRLTCGNTNTLIPYVDLVQEVLESYVALGRPRANNTGEGSTAGALDVQREYGADFPERVSEQAYDQLREAVFPFALPFDRSTESVRAYLEQLGSSRHEVMSAFPEHLPASEQSDVAAAAEYLGLSLPEYQVIAEPGSDPEWPARTPELHSRIAEEAYERFGERGGAGGNAVADWLAAEREWTGAPVRPLREYYGYRSDTELENGLIGQYFAGIELAGAPQLTRVDARLAFDWQLGEPAAQVGPNMFSVRWTGRLGVPASGAYTLYARADDGVRVTVNGTRIIDRWIDQGATEHAGTPVQLNAWEPAHITVEYYERTGASVAELRWSGPGVPKEIVPARYLWSHQPWAMHLASVPEFLRRTGLVFQELLDLLATRLVNPDPAAPRVALQSAGDPYDLATTRLTGLEADGGAPLRDIHRFIRLWRKVGGTMAELDRAVAVFGRGAEGLVEGLADARRLGRELASLSGAAVPQSLLLALWHPLDTRGADAPYQELFQNRALSSPLDAELALMPRPTAYWRFDEGRGRTTHDGSGHGHAGILYGPTWSSGKHGGALSFDGVDDYVHVSAPRALEFGNALTMAAWIHPVGPGNGALGGGGIILCKEAEYEIARFADGTIHWALACEHDPRWLWQSTGYVAPLNAWTHVAVAFDGSHAVTYANGVEVHRAPARGALRSVNPEVGDLRIGGRQHVPQHFHGRIDEVRLYDRVLGAREVAALAARQPAAESAELVGSGTPLDAKAQLLGAVLRLSTADLAAVRADAGLAGAEAKVSLAALSALHRRALLARAMRLTVPEFLALKALVGVDPFASPAATLRLVGALREIREAGFSIALLEYLLRDAPALAPAPAVEAGLVRTLRQGLARIAEETAPRADDEGSWLRDLLGATLEPAALPAAIQVVDGTHPGSEAERADFIARHLPFLPGEEALAILLPPPGEDAVAARQARRAFVLGHLLAHRRDAQSRAFTVATLVAALKLDEERASTLVREVVAAAGDPRRSALDDFLAMSGPGRGDGLLGTYFSGDLAGPVLTRVDEKIDFHWGTGAPHPVLGNAFTARWTGKVLAPATGTYTFQVTVDDGARLWIDGRSLIDEWEATSGTFSGTIDLQGGRQYDIVLEMRERGAVAGVQLAWSSGSVPRAVVPRENLFSGREAGAFREQLRTFRRLHKAAQLTQRFGLTADELRHLARHPADFDGLDFDALPVDGPLPGAALPARFRQWQRLRELAAVRPRAAGTRTLLDVFRVARAGDRAARVTDAVLDTLAEAQGWNRDDLEAAVRQGHPRLTGGDFVNARAIERLARALALAKRIGVPAARLASWANDPPDAAQAAAVRDAAKARYDEAAWIRAAAPVADALRERQRDALVAYVLQQTPMKDRGITTPNQLFEYFLIDVEMGTCMKTSRIRQAIASAQLFVQRCLLNLEPEVPPAGIEEEDWAWMKNYRVWEANRKVFLYPENWIEPELRDDKSPFFRELETDLLQTEVTQETASAALESYLDKLDDVARLEIVGMWSGRVNGRVEHHVFGRTYGKPHVLYYRREVAGAWTAWERVDVDVQSEHVFPGIYGGQLYLFWPTFARVADPADNPDAAQGAALRERHEITLSWSEYRGNRWTPKRQFPKPLRTAIFPNPNSNLARPSKFMFGGTLFATNAPFEIIVVRELDESPIHSMVITGPVGQFNVTDIHGNVNVGPTTSYFPPYYYWNATAGTMDNQQLRVAFPGLSMAPSRWGPATALPTPVLRNGNGGYRLVGTVWTDFFFQDRTRTFFARRVYRNTQPWEFTFEAHDHPLSREFMKVLRTRGIPALLSLATQRTELEDAPGAAFRREYEPDVGLVGTHPRRNVDFEPGGAYSVYNAELFFHAPLLIADRLRRDQRFAEAQRWFHYIFNPTTDSAAPSPARYWNYLPFHQNTEDQRIQVILRALADPDTDPEVRERLAAAIADWRDNPFQPHRVARLRLGSYQKAVVMKYLDNLIEWGDHLFAQGTGESVAEATQLYVLAANILGPRPERIPELVAPAPRTYAQIKGDLDAFGNVLVDAQNRVPYVAAIPSGGTQSPRAALAAGFGVGQALYFGVPSNDRLLEYWNRVDDRLAKIRSCRNLQGTAVTLALFEPPIDPALLVRARAAGLDLATVLSDASAPLGAYRFAYLLPRALELVADVRSLGSALLAALEKRDAEALSALRAAHESGMLRAVRQVKEDQIEEVRAALEGVRKTRAVTEARHAFYRSLEYINGREKEHLQRLDKAQDFQIASQITEMAGSAAALLPTVQIGVSGFSGSPVLVGDWGGINLAGSLQAVSRGLGFLASLETYKANRASLLGGWDRRQAEWKLQEELAARELEQIDRQILGAEIRLAVAERELANHDRQVENAAEVEAFLRDKFTGEELYSWMSGQLSSLYFQSYQLAYATAKRVERAYRFERGITDSGYIQFGHWDSLRKGLMAGERLHLDLKRLEMAQLDQNGREHELTKHVSLALHDPRALIALKETGQCTFELPEAVFDLDHPGHYMRRLKSMSVTIPCVVGPYTGINAKLTLLASAIRTDGTAAAPYEARDEDPRFLRDFSAAQSIVTSHAQNDAGMFELSFRDERYLPFEGAGAVSRWRLEMLKAANAFDFDTITDVILKLSYTARDGGELLRRAALEAAILPGPAEQPAPGAELDAPAQPTLQRMFSLRHEFADAWRRFLHPSPAGPSQKLQLALGPERFPYRFRGRAPTVKGMGLFLKLRDGTEYPAESAPLKVFIRPPGAATDDLPLPTDPHGLLKPEPVLDGVPCGEVDLAAAGRGYGTWTVELTSEAVADLHESLRTSVTVGAQTFHRLRPEAIDDLAVICTYEVPG